MNEWVSEWMNGVSTSVHNLASTGKYLFCNITNSVPLSPSSLGAVTGRLSEV